MGSALSGKQTSKTEIPKWIEDASKQAINAGTKLGQVGYIPYRGPEVAAFTAPQLAAFQNNIQGANAFGMNVPAGAMAGMPAPQQFAGGLVGYSSMPGYRQAMDMWRQQAPGQFGAYRDFFIDPRTGAAAKYNPAGGGTGTQKGVQKTGQQNQTGGMPGAGSGGHWWER